MEDAASLHEHVRVRCDHNKTAFISVDVRGGATGDTLRSAAAEALGLDGTVGLLPDGDRDSPLEDGIALNAQGVAVDDLIWVVRKGPSGQWEPPRAAPEAREADLLSSKVSKGARISNAGKNSTDG